jgi:hypothetical protein
MKREFRFQLVIELIFVLLLYSSCRHKPTVTTEPITEIETTQAKTGGVVTNDGNSAVVDRGVCWSKSSDLLIEDNKTHDGLGLGYYKSSMTHLIPNTMYFVKAYATNRKGTCYGNEVSFRTKSLLAILTTSPITHITSSTAESGGNVTSNGASDVIARGVCWNDLPEPTVDNNHTINGAGTGIFSSSITGLKAGTGYYFRAYATNSFGIAYGNSLPFTTHKIIKIELANNWACKQMTEVSILITPPGGSLTGEAFSEIPANSGSYVFYPPNVNMNGASQKQITFNYTSLEAETASFNIVVYDKPVGKSYGDLIGPLQLLVSLTGLKNVKTVVLDFGDGGSTTYDVGSMDHFSVSYHYPRAGTYAITSSLLNGPCKTVLKFIYEVKDY